MKSDWYLIVEKFEQRLADWKGRFLPFRGHLTLISAVLLNLPIYFFSITLRWKVAWAFEIFVLSILLSLGSGFGIWVVCLKSVLSLHRCGGV